MADNESEINPDSQTYGRPLSIEDASNRFLVHPLSDKIVKLALHLRISANMVSVTGLAFGLLAGWFYFKQGNPVFAVAGFISMFAWHVLDGADGKIARATKTTSSLGRIIDGICDHLVFGSVYLGFAFYILTQDSSPFIWVLVIAAAFSHGIQSASYEERRQKYHRRLNRLDRDIIAAKHNEVAGKKSVIANIYDSVQQAFSSRNSPLDSWMSQPQRSSCDIQRAANKTIPMIHAWGLLNANNRTFMLLVMALAGKPEWFFIYELVILNLLFIALVIGEGIFEKQLVAKLQQHCEQVKN